MEQPGFPHWAGLCDDLKLQIISKMDCKTRRFLRNGSRKDKQLVERFPWREMMKFTCEFRNSSGKWLCFYTDNYEYPRVPNSVNIKYFNTRDEAYDHMRKVLPTAEKVDKFSIESKLNSRVILSDSRRVINVRFLNWKLIEGENDESKLECYSFLFNQINLLCLKNLTINMHKIGNNTPTQNDSLFELERTQMNLDDFHFSGLINDEQFLGIRSNSFHLNNCSLISPSAFVRFIKRMMLQQPSRSSSYQLEKFSSEFQLYFFGTIYHNTSIQLMMNVVGSDLKLHIRFYSHMNSPSCDVRIMLAPLDQFLRSQSFAVNTRALEICPYLCNFISTISGVLPPGFPLMRDLRNQ